MSVNLLLNAIDHLLYSEQLYQQHTFSSIVQKWSPWRERKLQVFVYYKYLCIGGREGESMVEGVCQPQENLPRGDDDSLTRVGDARTRFWPNGHDIIISFTLVCCVSMTEQITAALAANSAVSLAVPTFQWSPLQC
jgi:hypothetical protein